MSRRTIHKQRNIERMKWLYAQRAYSDIEMAEVLGVDRTTVYRTRQQMETELGMPFYEEGDGRYRLDPNALLSSLEVTPAEALALYLGGRRLQQQTRSSQADVANALYKLSQALRRPLMGQLVRAAEVILSQEQDLSERTVMETLLQGWTEGFRVRIRHSKLHSAPRTYTVSPYVLEPAVWGDGVYLIGYSDYHEGLATFKVSRIAEAQLLPEPYTIPEDFDVHALLQHAWGIWQADGNPETVCLRFSAVVAPRVRESIWHPSQMIRELDDGGCEWQAEIAEWREMVPWIRGWGADCEVLKPDGLRETIAAHVAVSALQYSAQTHVATVPDRLLRCWGKTGPTDAAFHPAFFHMLDVGHVAQHLLSSRASPRWRQVLARALSADANSLIEWLPWLVALHDLGKISIPFQAQNAAQYRRMLSEGFDFGRWQPTRSVHHTIAGHMILQETLGDRVPSRLMAVLREMLAGHHGEYRQLGWDERRAWRALQEPSEWADLRRHAAQILAGQLLLVEPETWPEPENISAAIAALNGFTILCDWLGSDGAYFFPSAHVSLSEYMVRSRARARERVRDASFWQPVYSQAPTRFSALFPNRSARPLQRVVDAIPADLLAEPSLSIIEAPTGEGKTEAALALARRIAALRGTDEMYVALPTTATSNQMFVRVQEHLQQRLGLDERLVRLVHGQDFLMEDDLLVEPLPEAGQTDDHPALAWFDPRKRALLAPFGVGTIDQAELVALSVRHNALRLIGLAGKTVILDEVHAYDTYMSTIIERMLAWLEALGSSVILLSATLPAARRRALTAAFGGSVPVGDVESAYPSLAVTTASNYFRSNPAAFQPDRHLRLEWLHLGDDDAEAKARWLLAEVADGGCACWIANTVARSQEIFRALQEIAPKDVSCTLLHSRYPLEDRQKREGALAAAYGPPERAERPRRGIVVGTQVLEQSLDLDFDVMSSDIAPVDLLLQRAGRMHRHDRPRPLRHEEPAFYVNARLDDNGGLLAESEPIYEEYVLRKTWETLASRNGLQLPADYRLLVEEVYSEDEPDPTSPLAGAWLARRRQETLDRQEAELRLTLPPDPEEPFCHHGRLAFFDDENSAAWIAAQTRLGQETVTLIPLERRGDEALLTPLPESAPLDRPVSRSVQLRLLRRQVRVSHRGLVRALHQAAEPLPVLFEQSPLLRRAQPLWLHDGQARLPVNNATYHLVLDPALGLVISREGD